MTFTFDWLVADVAENLVARFTGEHVVIRFLPSDLIAMRTLDHRPDVDIRILTHSHITLYHFCSNFERLQMRFFINALRILLVVLLTFGWIKAGPTEVLPTLRTLDVSAATFYLGNPDATLGIWTKLCTLLYVDLVEPVLYLFV